ncbi:MAG: hypothetical protein R2880_16350 [Deinococcales bacterium]
MILRLFTLPRLAVLLLGLFAFQPALAQDSSLSREVWLIPIDSEITPATAQFVRTRLERANQATPNPSLLSFSSTPPAAASMLWKTSSIIFF